MRPLLSSDVTYEVLDFGLHITPEKLRESLQQTVDKIGDAVDVIVLGYGLCSTGVVGLTAEKCTLVVPRVDDCIVHIAYPEAHVLGVREELIAVEKGGTNVVRNLAQQWIAVAQGLYRGVGMGGIDVCPLILPAKDVTVRAKE